MTPIQYEDCPCGCRMYQEPFSSTPGQTYRLVIQVSAGCKFDTGMVGRVDSHVRYEAMPEGIKTVFQCAGAA